MTYACVEKPVAESLLRLAQIGAIVRESFVTRRFAEPNVCRVNGIYRHFAPQTPMIHSSQRSLVHGG